MIKNLYNMIIKYIINVYKNPLEVRTKRNKIQKTYGYFEELIRSIVLPYESQKALIETLKEMLLLWIPILTLLVMSMTVISGSMSPTLVKGDFLVSSSAYYGGSLSSIPFNKYFFTNYRIFKFSEIKRGNVVAFKNEIDMNKIFVKRVIGIPGDSIQLKNGHLYINKIPVELKRKENCFYEEDGKDFGPYDTYEELLPGEKAPHTIIFQEGKGMGFFDDTEEFIIPKDCYFVMGDNRHDSADSRSLMGFVKKKHIIGRIMCIILNHQHGLLGSLFGNPILWLKGFNFKRLFIKIK
ncbi:signal peptidase I [Rickettsiales bacterium (ex Bugula neritina AB1)]|nr:signal peptidase I [Rickettsiales bacterium (ex Bugula neritina AB1)]